MSMSDEAPEVERMPHGNPAAMTTQELVAALNCYDDIDAEVASRLAALEAENARLRDALAGLSAAVRPFVSACFYDNGDVTLSRSMTTDRDLAALFWQSRAARAALATAERERDEARALHRDLDRIDQEESDEVDGQRVKDAYRRGQEAMRERAAGVADGYHQRALEWAKKVRGLERHIGETDSSRIAAAIRALPVEEG